MDFGHNFEEAEKPLADARDQAEETISRCGTQFRQKLEEVAQAVNMPTVTKTVDKALLNLDAALTMMKDMLGTEGDEASAGTVYGAIKYTDRGLVMSGLK